MGRADLAGVKTNTVEEQTLQVTSWPPPVLTNSPGQVGDTPLACDLVLLATGHPPATAQATRLLPLTSIDHDGRVKVNNSHWKYIQCCLQVDPFFGVEGCPGVFALGDVANTPEHKMAAHAGVHAETVVSNLVLEAGGRWGSWCFFYYISCYCF